MDPDFTMILTAALLGAAVGLSLEAINPHRKPDSKANPVTAGVVWAIVIAAASLLG